MCAWFMGTGGGETTTGEMLTSLPVCVALSPLVILSMALQVGQSREDVRQCEGGHYLSSASRNGEVLILGDGSVWQVNSTESMRSMLWLPFERLIVCTNNTIINVERREPVTATRIG
jgi:hypothetical protein